MTPGHAPKILIIDDSETDRYLYRRYLELGTLPYDVHEAHDKTSGLACADALNPDCILLDLKLSNGESGYEVLQDLVGEKSPPKRRVIILTVLSLRSLREGALSLGASDFLVKGETDAAALDRAVRQAIDTPPQVL
jgi:two-component system, sporulation sensor kinase E